MLWWYAATDAQLVLLEAGVQEQRPLPELVASIANQITKSKTHESMKACKVNLMCCTATEQQLALVEAGVQEQRPLPDLVASMTNAHSTLQVWSASLLQFTHHSIDPLFLYMPCAMQHIKVLWIYPNLRLSVPARQVT